MSSHQPTAGSSEKPSAPLLEVCKRQEPAPTWPLSKARATAKRIHVGDPGNGSQRRADYLTAHRKMTSIDYELIVATDEDDHRLEVLHQNVRKYSSNAVATATRLQG